MFVRFTKWHEIPKLSKVLTGVGLTLLVAAACSFVGYTPSNTPAAVQLEQVSQSNSGIKPASGSSQALGRSTEVSDQHAKQTSSSSNGAANKPVSATNPTTKPAQKITYVPIPMPQAVPSISVEATRYGVSTGARSLPFTTINLRSAAGYLTAYQRLTPTVGVPRIQSYYVDVYPPADPNSNNSIGTAVMPEDLLVGSKAGDTFLVWLCENKGGSCGVTSNKLHVTISKYEIVAGGGGYYEYIYAR